LLKVERQREDYLRYVIFVIDSESNSGTGGEIEAIDSFNKDIRKNNQLIMAAGITGSKGGLLIDNRDGLFSVNQGSLNGDEFYSGFWIVEADDERQAKDLALRGSLACNRKVELRAFL